MIPWLRHRGALLVLLAALTVPAGLPVIGRTDPADPCERAKRVNGWCEEENVGYVASVPVRSKFLFEVLDTHGHEIIPEAVTCPICREALKTDGYCPDHKMGFVHGEAYLSPLTYHLARARQIDPSTLSCRTCRKHTRGIGWCEKDRVGIAGSFALDDRKEFEELEKAYAILTAAIEMSSRCETCAGAIITDGYCPTHRVTYDKGRPVSGTPP